MDSNSNKKPEGTLGTSNTLKGIAISAVLINHYINLNISGDHWGYANLWVAVFFIFSGYGLHFSYKNYLEGNFHLKAVLSFYMRRIIRVFPLLWLAWPIEFALRGGELSFWTLTGIHASEHYWFIPALLHCYLLSPFLYRALNKKPLVVITLLAAFIAAVNIAYMADAIPSKIMDAAVYLHWVWRDFYFLHILFFAVGAAIAPLSEQLKNNRIVKGSGNVAILWGLVFATMLLSVVFKHFSHLNSFMYRGFMVAPLIPLTILCIYSIIFSLRIRPLEFIGRMSYAVYLFHMSFFLIVNKMCGVSKNTIFGIVSVTILFPLFLFVCGLLEKLGKNIARRSRIGIDKLTGHPGLAMGEKTL